MKLANRNWVSFLKYYILIIALVLVGGICGMIFLNVNTSTDFTGGTNVEIAVQKADADVVMKNATKYLKDNKYSIEKKYVQYKGTEETIVLAINASDVDATALTDAIKTATEQSDVVVTEFGAIVRNDYIWKFAVLLASLTLLAVLYFGFQKSWIVGLCAGVTNLLSVLIILSIVVLSRIKVTMAGFAMVMLFSLIASVFAGVIGERVKHFLKDKDNKDMSVGEATNVVINRVLPAVSILFGTILVCDLAVLFIFIAQPMVVYFNLMILVCLIVTFFIALFVMPSINAELSQLHIDKQKDKLSKNKTEKTVVKPKTVTRKRTAKKKTVKPKNGKVVV